VDGIYNKVSSSISQQAVAAGTLAAALYWGPKFIHDFSFRRSISDFTPALQWLSLYASAEHGERFNESIGGKLEKAIQSQAWFFGRQKSRFVRQVMAEIDRSVDSLYKYPTREKDE